MKTIYLDYAATCPVDKKVLDKMKPYFLEKFANPSSMHTLGEEVREEVERARERLLKKVNGKEHRLVFTSGGTEANNLALKGIAESYEMKGKHIIVSKIEHDSVLKSAEYLLTKGFVVEYVENNKEGLIDLEDLKKKIRKDTILVSIMHANNEIGTIQPIFEIGKLCSEKEVFFHTDACQSFCKTEIDMIKNNISLLTISGHKVYGPKGVGALVVRKDLKSMPLLHGGGHENNFRSGSLNVPGIIGFGEASCVFEKKDLEKIEKIKDFIIAEIYEKTKNVKILGPLKNRLVNNIALLFEEIEPETLQTKLDLEGFMVSTGSACLSNNKAKSHVLSAIKLNPKKKNGMVRVSLGKETTLEEAKLFVKKIIEMDEKI